MELIAEYKQELEDLEMIMIEAQKFAEKLPVFSKQILRNKFTENFTGKMETSYDGLYYGWGINRYFYDKKENITNYRESIKPQYLWSVYINQYSLFGDNYTDTGIDDVCKPLDLFFYDVLNTTFYATDEQIVPLLDALSAWYKEAKEINAQFAKDKKRRDLEKQLEQLA